MKGERILCRQFWKSKTGHNRPVRGSKSWKRQHSRRVSKDAHRLLIGQMSLLASTRANVYRWGGMLGRGSAPQGGWSHLWWSAGSSFPERGCRWRVWWRRRRRSNHWLLMRKTFCEIATNMQSSALRYTKALPSFRASNPGLKRGPRYTEERGDLEQTDGRERVKKIMKGFQV